MTNQQKGAGAGRRHRALGLGAGGLGLAIALLAATPARCASTAQSFAAPAASGAVVTLAMNGASPAALATAMPQGEKCPQDPNQSVPAAPIAADPARCPPTITGRLLGLAARKAGQILSVPILIL